MTYIKTDSTLLEWAEWFLDEHVWQEGPMGEVGIVRANAADDFKSVCERERGRLVVKDQQARVSAT